VRARLRAAADGSLRVLHRGPHAAYVDLDGWCVGVVAARAAAVPCALRVAASDLAGIDTGRAELRDGVLHLGGRALTIGRLVDVGVPRPGRDLRLGTELVTARPAGFPDRVDADTVGSFVGRGDGLTPLGDDLLCGWIAAHRAEGVATPHVDAAVRAALGRTTLLSATLLDCALHGEVLPEYAAWLAAVGTPAAPVRARALAAVGHTSGLGLLAGGRLALAALAGHHLQRSRTA
jgi:hypothetical protein